MPSSPGAGLPTSRALRQVAHGSQEEEVGVSNWTSEARVIFSPSSLVLGPQPPSPTNVSSPPLALCSQESRLPIPETCTEGWPPWWVSRGREVPVRGSPGRCLGVAVAAPAWLLLESRGVFLSSRAPWCPYGEIHPVRIQRKLQRPCRARWLWPRRKQGLSVLVACHQSQTPG